MKKKDSSAGRAIVIGAGHNGLVCAFYLARAGWRVDVYEKRPVLGGAAITDSFFPGFRNSIASYTVSLLDEAIIEDMRLRDFGLRIVERPLSNFLPLEDGKSLSAGGGLAATQASFAKVSEKDAAALPAYYAQLERMGQALAKLAREVPPAWEAESSWRNWLKNEFGNPSVPNTQQVGAQISREGSRRHSAVSTQFLEIICVLALCFFSHQPLSI